MEIQGSLAHSTVTDLGEPSPFLWELNQNYLFGGILLEYV